MAPDIISCVHLAPIGAEAAANATIVELGHALYF